jgi:hypothetical protein
MHRIWDIQTDVAGWPAWQTDVDATEAEGPLGSARCFGGRPRASTSPRPSKRSMLRSASSGAALRKESSPSTFDLRRHDGDLLVRTAQSWEGDPVTAEPEAMQAALDASLRAWLENLKREAESRSGLTTASARAVRRRFPRSSSAKAAG